MKIANTGLELPAGKVKYHDRIIEGLTEKFEPKKVSPYFFEVLPDDYEKADAIAILKSRLLDLLVLDIEKLETRISRADDPAELAALKKCLAHLESEKPVCDLVMTDPEKVHIAALAPLSLKATVVVEESAPDANKLFAALMEKAGVMFFYTAGKQEVRAWFIKKGFDAVTCAGKIHSDLARGFVKAEVIKFDDLMTSHSFPDARTKGLTKLVDKDFIIEPETVLEIRFNV